MNWVAWKMLTGDRAKYLATVFGVAFGTVLISQQTSIFVGLMRRTASQILDVREANIWVMDAAVQNSDEVKPLSDNDLYRVRGVSGVSWAVRLYKGLTRAKVADGSFRQVMLLGIDDDTLVGAPIEMIEGTLADLRRPDAVIIDKAGYEYLWPDQPVELGRPLQINDRRAIVVGVCNASPPFQTFPVMYARYTQAMAFIPYERNRLSFVLASPKPDLSIGEVCDQIQKQTGLLALSRSGFMWQTIGYYIKTTGIPINFGITIVLGFIVGTAIAGQTFYLFTLENLRQFGTLKAMGLSNLRVVLMILLQATAVGVLGFGVGIGVTAFFFVATQNVTHLAGFYLPWQVAALSAISVEIIATMASFMSVRKVLILEPAVVFRT